MLQFDFWFYLSQYSATTGTVAMIDHHTVMLMIEKSEICLLQRERVLWCRPRNTFVLSLWAAGCGYTA
jgi:hypothetical protein